MDSNYTLTEVRDVTELGWVGTATLYQLSAPATLPNGMAVEDGQDSYSYVVISAANIDPFMGLFGDNGEDETAVFAVQEDGITPLSTVALPGSVHGQQNVDAAREGFVNWLNAGSPEFADPFNWEADGTSNTQDDNAA